MYNPYNQNAGFGEAVNSLNFYEVGSSNEHIRQLHSTVEETSFQVTGENETRTGELKRFLENATKRPDDLIKTVLKKNLDGG